MPSLRNAEAPIDHLDLLLPARSAIAAPAGQEPAPLADPGDANAPRWTIGELNIPSVDLRLAASDDDLVCLVCACSFIESGTALYAANLSEHFADEPAVVRWLDERWESDELRHGRALRAYLAQAWPHFDWQAGFDSFFGEYSTMCSPELLERSRALEMVARCVVEMGTATLYRSISATAQEPVLKRLAWEIAQDETLHYKNFLAFFKARNAREKKGRWAVLGALSRRVWELRADDADCALRHVFAHRHPEWDAEDIKAARKRVNAVARRQLPASLAAKMLLKPLDLPVRAQKWIEPAVERAARLALATV